MLEGVVNYSSGYEWDNRSIAPVARRNTSLCPKAQNKNEKTYSTRDSRVIPHLSTNLACGRLASQFGMGCGACASNMAVCAREESSNYFYIHMLWLLVQQRKNSRHESAQILGVSYRPTVVWTSGPGQVLHQCPQALFQQCSELSDTL